MQFSKVHIHSLINSHLRHYPTLVVGYMSSFGLLSRLCLVIPIVTGILLIAHYTLYGTLAFASVEHVMHDVNDGWLFFAPFIYRRP